MPIIVQPTLVYNETDRMLKKVKEKHQSFDMQISPLPVDRNQCHHHHVMLIGSALSGSHSAHAQTMRAHRLRDGTEQIVTVYSETGVLRRDTLCY
jgi:hypothetical protein